MEQDIIERTTGLKISSKKQKSKNRLSGPIIGGHGKSYEEKWIGSPKQVYNTEQNRSGPQSSRSGGSFGGGGISPSIGSLLGASGRPASLENKKKMATTPTGTQSGMRKSKDKGSAGINAEVKIAGGKGIGGDVDKDNASKNKSGGSQSMLGQLLGKGNTQGEEPVQQEKTKAELKAERARQHQERLAKQGIPTSKSQSQKNMTKQERRALQEAQREAKLQKDKGGVKMDGRAGGDRGAGVGQGGKLFSPSGTGVAAMGADTGAGLGAGSGIATGGGGGSGDVGVGADESGRGLSSYQIFKQEESRILAEKKIGMFEHIKEPIGRPVTEQIGARQRTHITGGIGGIGAGMGGGMTGQQVAGGPGMAGVKKVAKARPNIHPAIKTVGLRIAAREIEETNEKTVAVLQACMELVKSYRTPPRQTMARDLQVVFNHNIAFLVGQQQLTTGLGNCIRWVKEKISVMDIDQDESSNKEELLAGMAGFISERITAAELSVGQTGARKISSGDVVLTYGYSSSVFQILHHAHVDLGLRFRVVVVDSRLDFGGQRMVRRLTNIGVPPCDICYGLVSSAGYLMKQATKLLVGAEAVASNGAVVARAGTALVALAAHTHNVPVLVACETYKFFDDVRLDSVVNNVLGKAHDLVMLPSHPDASSNGLEAMQYAANPVNAHTAWPALNNTRTASDSISFTSIPDLADEPTEPRFFSHTRILTRRHALDLLTGRHTVLGADAASTPGSQRAEHSALDATSAARVWTDFEDANPLAAWREIDNLKVLNLAYDVTPSSFISVVITELGLIPTTSVPVVLREYKI